MTTALLKQDHATVKKLLASFAGTTARATKRRQALIDTIAEELEFYPAVKAARGGQSLVNEAESEHKEIDSLVAAAH